MQITDHVLSHATALHYFPCAEFSSGSYSSELQKTSFKLFHQLYVQRQSKKHCMLLGRILRTRQRQLFGCCVKGWCSLRLITASILLFTAQEGCTEVGKGTVERCHCYITARAIMTVSVQCRERRQGTGLIKHYKIMKGNKLVNQTPQYENEEVQQKSRKLLDHIGTRGWGLGHYL